MGFCFFDGIKEGMREAEAEREAKENGTYVYRPGKKNRTGPAKKTALINLLGTSDLDEVFECCAPHLTNTVYEIRDMLKDEHEVVKKYNELSGRYNELQKHYDELQKQYNELVDTMQVMIKTK